MTSWPDEFRCDRQSAAVRSRRLVAGAETNDSGIGCVAGVDLIPARARHKIGAATELVAERDQDSANPVVLAAWGDVPSRDGLPCLSPADGFVGRVLSSEHAADARLDPVEIAAAEARLAARVFVGLPARP